MALSVLHRQGRQRPSPDEMTLVEHLAELRRRLIVSIVALAIAGVVAFMIYNQLLSLLEHPYCEVARAAHQSCKLWVTGPLDGLTLRVKLSLYGGVFFASPVILWELWRFITPGLNPNEKRYAVPFVISSILLFSFGGLIAMLVLTHALSWLPSIGGPTLAEIYSPTKYLNLVVLMIVAFGLTFEFPVVLISLELAGILTPAKLSAWRRWAILAIAIVAAVITPSSDPFSMIAMAVPMYVFYELSIIAGRILRRR